MEKAYLVFGDGQILEGRAFGADRDALGELVFTTGMEGYVETLTDPSYAGQIVMQTFPLIGNYGVAEEDAEGDCALRGYIVREACPTPSHFRAEESLDAFLKKHNIPGICGIDTRELTRQIREDGVKNALICRQIPKDLSAVRSYAVRDAVAGVSCRAPRFFPAEGERRFSVVLIDYGAKRNIVRSLCRRGCDVTVLPYIATAEEVLAAAPDGVMLSNGPGDPAENTGCIAELKKLIGQVPVFGICLGHQLAALAMGGRTHKLKYGHRGTNQPVRDLKSGRTYITCQNHGYAVEADSLAGVAELTFQNANDGSCEGLSYPGLRCFTVQFHPEACAGPRDTAFLFDRFLEMMGGNRHAGR